MCTSGWGRDLDMTHAVLTPASLREGVRWLAGLDDDLAGVFRRTGFPPLWGRPAGFSTLVRIILEQQVSLGAARTMYGRLAAHTGRVTPGAIVRVGQEGLRALGFTRQKARYCHGLAELVRSGALDLRAIAAAPEEAGRQMLLAVPGLGPWTVDIYYLMALRRPDVWPRGDLALALALRDVKWLPAVPSPAEQERIAGAWAPWRAVAARLLWKHYLATPRGVRSPTGPSRG
jgi:DNA-3-methyladenine glycosylase II